jgi:hypothetical protein
MKSSVISINREDWEFMKMLKGNIKWMKSQTNPELFLISTRKESILLEQMLDKYKNVV